MKSPQRQGIETRSTTTGEERFRAAVKVRNPDGSRAGKRGPWRSSLSEARADRVRLLAAKDAGTLSPSAYPTLRQAADGFLDDALDGRARTRSGTVYKGSTLRGYRRSLRDRFPVDLAARPVDRLRRSEVQRWIDETTILRSGQTARNDAAALGALYRHLRGRFDGLDDVTAGVQLPAGAKARDRVASPAELDALLDVLDQADAVVYATAAYAGLRLGELRALRVEDLDLRAGVLRVSRSLDPVGDDVGPKSAAGFREVPILSALRPRLDEHLDALDAAGSTSGLVFPGFGRWGNREGPFSPTALATRAAEAWKDAGLDPLGLHEARHSFVSLVIAAGVNAKVVQKWAGHASVSTTLDVYAKTWAEHERSSAGAVDVFLARSGS